MSKEIFFSDSENPTECQMTGQVTTLIEISDNDLAYVKQVLEILLRILRMWIQFSRNRKQMNEALSKFQVMLFTEPHAFTTYQKVGILFKNLQCTSCGHLSKNLPGKHCPGCGKQISN